MEYCQKKKNLIIVYEQFDFKIAVFYFYLRISEGVYKLCKEYLGYILDLKSETCLLI